MFGNSVPIGTRKTTTSTPQKKIRWGLKKDITVCFEVGPGPTPLNILLVPTEVSLVPRSAAQTSDFVVLRVFHEIELRNAVIVLDRQDLAKIMAGTVAGILRLPILAWPLK